MKRDIEGKLAASSGKIGAGAFWGVFSFTLLMITREGMETAMLMNALLFQVKAMNIVAGAVGGTLVAAFIAYLWSRFGHRVNLARFFQVTAIFLLVFVVQLLIYGFHELAEAHVLPNSERAPRGDRACTGPTGSTATTSPTCSSRCRSAGSRFRASSAKARAPRRPELLPAIPPKGGSYSPKNRVASAFRRNTRRDEVPVSTPA